MCGNSVDKDRGLPCLTAARSPQSPSTSLYLFSRLEREPFECSAMKDLLKMSPCREIGRSCSRTKLTLLVKPRNNRPGLSTQRFHATASAKQTSASINEAKPHTIDPRWLTDIKRRIGKCLMFGMKPAQVREAGMILQLLARDWRELIAGSEGFLTHPTRRALYRRDVVWGDMVYIYIFFFSPASEDSG